MFIEPVFGKKFFGREEVLATLHKRVTALKGGYRQNLALTGPMLAGKSSILRHFLKNITDSSVIPLYIEMGEEDFQVFCTRMMATLLFMYLKSQGIRHEGDFEQLKDACREMAPDTIKCIDGVCKALKQKKDDMAYEKLLGLTAVFKTETGKSCIVILDEFHNLANFRLKKPFRTFGKFIMVQKNTMYVVSSSQKTLLKDLLAKKLSLLFGNFEVIEVNGFDNQTARSFIADKIKGYERCEDVRNYLIQLTQGNPFYLELLSKRFSEIAKSDDERRNPKECLLEAFAQLLYTSDGILNQYFTNSLNFFLEKKSRKVFIPILIAMSRGRSRLKTIQDELGRTDKSLSGKLQKLQNMDMVYKSGVFYKLSDKLFEYWLKNVHCLKSKSMIDDIDIKFLEFKNAADRDYSEYCRFSAKGVDDIVCGVFEDFSGERIVVGVHERKMPSFDAVGKKVLSGSGLFEITGAVGDRKWICRIKRDERTTEGDINDLAGLRPVGSKGKITRKIFVSLKGIEQNAFLLAKEKNIWIWDARQLNDILRLFVGFELVL